MPFKDVLLHLTTYPDATPATLIDEAVDVCAALSERAAAVAVQVDIPVKSNRMADLLIGLSDMAREEEQKSRDAAEAALARFRTRAAERGLAASALSPTATLYEIGERVARMARTRDLAVVPLVDERDEQQRAIAEAVTFEGGRPVVVFRAGRGASPTGAFGRIVVAWDGGRSAARAVADAMPMLAAATQVRILAVTNEKPSAVAGAASDLVRHLADHGIAAEVDEVDADGEKVGAVFRRYLAGRPADLLVMGAYGHSRVREFVLGGATQDVLDDPPVAVFLSH